jgi:hypothetical protein
MRYFKQKKAWIICIILIISLTYNNFAFAQSINAVSKETLSDTVFTMLGSLLNLLYLITLPVLVIAGKAMDNSMVYGEFINLDAPLWMLRNLSRTFANFAIGGVILRKIVEYLFNDWSWKSPTELKKIITKSIIMVLAINSSWFIIGTLVDLSTIITYAVGAMPLTTLKESGDKDMPILAVESYFDYTSQKQLDQNNWSKIAPYVYYKWGNINIPRCGVGGKLYKWSIVLWPEYFPSLPSNNNVSFQTDGKQYCALNAQTLVDITAIKKFKEKIAEKYLDNTQDNSILNATIIESMNKISSSTWCDNIAFTGQTVWNKWVSIQINKKEVEELLNSLTIWDAGIESLPYCNKSITITKNAYKNNNRQSNFLPWTNNPPYSNQTNGLTMHTLIQKSKGMVWPFITLYITMLDFSNLSVQDTKDQTVTTTIGWISEFFLKTWISIALFIPLVALAITLIVRIVLLRWIIAFIPLGIVIYGLQDTIKLPWGWIKVWNESITAWSIVWLIFSPVLPVFTISISIIILQTLQIAMKEQGDNSMRKFMGITNSSYTNTKWEQMTCTEYRWLQTDCINKGNDVSGGSWFANFIPRLFINIFAIWLMWMMVKVSLSGSKLTSSIWTKIMELWANAIGSIPLLSIWWKQVGASALSKTFNTGINTANEALNNAVSKQEKDITDLREPVKNDSTTSSFQIKNETVLKEDITKKMKTSKISTWESFKEVFTQSLEDKEKDTKTIFSTLNTSQQSNEMIKFLWKLNSIETTNKENIQKELIQIGYKDFIDNDVIKKEKMNEFINYINGENIIKTITDEKNSILKENIQQFKNIEFDTKSNTFKAKKT